MTNINSSVDANGLLPCQKWLDQFVVSYRRMPSDGPLFAVVDFEALVAALDSRSVVTPEPEAEYRRGIADAAKACEARRLQVIKKRCDAEGRDGAKPETISYFDGKETGIAESVEIIRALIPVSNQPEDSPKGDK